MAGRSVTSLPDAERRDLAVRAAMARARSGRVKGMDPTTSEIDYSDEEVAFLRAMDDFKRATGHKFPTYSQILGVLKSLGYRRIAERSTDGPAAQSAASDLPRAGDAPTARGA